MVVIDERIIFWLKLRGVVNKIRDGIADDDLKIVADEAYYGTFLMPMKKDIKTTAGEAYDDRKRADGAGAEGFIVIKAGIKVDRCCFPFLYLLEYNLCKSHVLS